MVGKVNNQQFRSDVCYISKKLEGGGYQINQGLRNYLIKAENVTDIIINKKLISYNCFQSAETSLGQCSKKESKEETKYVKIFLSKIKNVFPKKEMKNVSSRDVKVIQFLGWHGTSAPAAKKLIEHGLSDNYEPNSKQIEDNVQGEGFYISENKVHAKNYAIRTPAQKVKEGGKEGEVIEVWTALDSDALPSVFDIEAAKNKDELIVRSEFNNRIFLTPDNDK